MRQKTRRGTRSAMDLKMDFGPIAGVFCLLTEGTIALKHITRTPPETVVRILRNEVGFACPVCGSPFLTWHHFDPPWREKKHHNPTGMVALCPEHAAQADGGHWSTEQLRSLKHPLNLASRIAANWPWKPEKAVFMLGNSYYIGERPLLSVGGRSVFSASRSYPDGFDNPVVTFSIDFRDESGRSILLLKDNFLLIYTSNLSDIRCPPQARIFEVISNSGIRLKLQHKRLPLDAFLEQVPPSSYNIYDTVESVSRLIQASSIDSDGLIPLIEIEGDLKSRDVELHLSREQFTLRMKSYNNESVNMQGKFYSTPGSLIIKQGQRELIKFG